MADERTPRPKIELGEKDEAPEAAPAGARDEGASAADAARTGVGRVTAWVRRTFPGHENAFWGGVVGLLAAVAFFVLGIWRTLVIVVLVVAGVAVGQALDGDAKIVRALRNLFTRSNQ